MAGILASALLANWKKEKEMVQSCLIRMEKKGYPEQAGMAGACLFSVNLFLELWEEHLVTTLNLEEEVQK